ncbi:MAG TPA: PspC domain-containing protein, partial [Mycobacteriales bacterium]|nr:PspC domain-containing protein [Mycobacteriales bacterium]
MGGAPGSSESGADPRDESVARSPGEQPTEAVGGPVTGASRAGEPTVVGSGEQPTAVVGGAGAGASRADGPVAAGSAEEPTVVVGGAERTAPAGSPAGPPPFPPGGGGGDVPPPGGFGPPGGPPPPYQPPRRLHRSRQRKVVAGVAGGLGEYTGVDPVLFRVLFAVLTVFGGAGILLYLLGWLFLPAEDEPTSPVESLIGRGTTGRRAGDVLLALGLVVFGLIFAGILANGDAGDVVLCLLVVGGLVLLIRNLDERRDGQPSAAPPSLTTPPPAYQPYSSYEAPGTAAVPAGP